MTSTTQPSQTTGPDLHFHIHLNAAKEVISVEYNTDVPARTAGRTIITVHSHGEVGSDNPDNHDDDHNIGDEEGGV